MATAMQNMMIYVTDTQKRALQRRARQRGTSVAKEVRSAIDTHLAGVNADELALLDAATRRAENDIREMVARLDRTNRKVDAILAARPERRRTRA
ncbi:MAG: hypothetical protein ACREVG_17270 [Burkholderiales bacterium]